MYDPDVVCLGEFHNLFKKGQIRHFCGGVVRIAEKKQFGLGPRLAGCGFKVFKKIPARADGHAAHVRARNDGGVFVDGVGGVWRKHHIAGFKHGQRKVGQTFFGTHSHDGFGFRVQVHVKVALVAVTDGLAQVGDAARKGIAVVDGLECCLCELFHNGCGRRDVRIAHAEVHDVDILPTKPHLEVPNYSEHVGGQAANA